MTIENEKKSVFDIIRKTVMEAKESVVAVSGNIIDLTTDSGALENVPLVSLAMGGLKIKDAYHINRLKRNVLSFLESTKHGDPKKLNIAFNEIDCSEQEEFVDTCLALIIDSEKPLKAKLLGNLLVSLSENSLSYEEFDEISLLIINASIPALKDIPNYFMRLYEEGSNNSRSLSGQVSCYLVSMGLAMPSANLPAINELGVRIYRCAFLGDLDVDYCLRKNGDINPV